MMTPLPPTPATRILGGRYRLGAELGRGGMGVVFAGQHLLTERRVAIKVVQHAADASDRKDERFLSEARTSAAIHHPHVVDVLDMGRDGDELFLVMELLCGRTLESVLAEGGPIAPAQALAWLLPIMDALDVLHHAGVVHRDVKPANIFLSETAQGIVPKLLDFGLAQHSEAERITATGIVVGTPLYMSPEHAAGLSLTPRADVWSLGIVLYECLAGEAPFPAHAPFPLATQVLLGRVRPLGNLMPDLPPLLLAAVDRALARDCDQRHPSVRAFAEALLKASSADNLGQATLRETQAWSAPLSASSATSRAPRAQPRHSARFFAILAAGALLIAAGALALYSGKSTSRANAPEADAPRTPTADATPSARVADATPSARVADATPSARVADATPSTAATDAPPRAPAADAPPSAPAGAAQRLPRAQRNHPVRKKSSSGVETEWR